MLTQEYLLQTFNYNPTTGILSLKKKIKYLNKEIGDEAGHLAKSGYRSVGIKGKEYRVHRIIYLMQTGKWPDNQIDHIDRIKDNNRWTNLRDATPSENSCNVTTTNALGIKGISKHKHTGDYHAHITKDKIVYQKAFKNLDDARDWIDNKRKLLHGDFAP